jgi:hypothetical protein
MKKTLLLLIAFMVVSFTYAQSGFDAKALAGEIMGKLSPALALTAEQKPSVNEVVTVFLKKKAEIIPLQKADLAAYTSKFNVLNGDLVNQLKEILTAKQMSSFLGLKPRVNMPGNVLSELFF